MDVPPLVFPGAQALVSSILMDGWEQARSALARCWSRKGAISRQAAEQELDKGHALSQYIDAPAGLRQRLLETYWTGYLAGLAAGNASLLDAISELEPTQTWLARESSVHNSNSGVVGTLLQARDIHGDMTFGR